MKSKQTKQIIEPKKLHEYTLAEMISLPDKEVERLHKILVEEGGVNLKWHTGVYPRSLRFKASLDERNDRIRNKKR
jgi:hypothetical protein